MCYRLPDYIVLYHIIGRPPFKYDSILYSNFRAEIDCYKKKCVDTKNEKTIDCEMMLQTLRRQLNRARRILTENETRN